MEGSLDLKPCSKFYLQCLYIGVREDIYLVTSPAYQGSILALVYPMIY